MSISDFEKMMNMRATRLNMDGEYVLGISWFSLSDAKKKEILKSLCERGVSDDTDCMMITLHTKDINTFMDEVVDFVSPDDTYDRYTYMCDGDIDEPMLTIINDLKIHNRGIYENIFGDDIDIEVPVRVLMKMITHYELYPIINITKEGNIIYSLNDDDLSGEEHDNEEEHDEIIEILNIKWDMLSDDIRLDILDKMMEHPEENAITICFSKDCLRILSNNEYNDYSDILDNYYILGDKFKIKYPGVHHTLTDGKEINIDKELIINAISNEDLDLLTMYSNGDLIVSAHCDNCECDNCNE